MDWTRWREREGFNPEKKGPDGFGIALLWLAPRSRSYLLLTPSSGHSAYISLTLFFISLPLLNSSSGHFPLSPRVNLCGESPCTQSENASFSFMTAERRWPGFSGLDFAFQTGRMKEMTALFLRLGTSEHRG